MEVFALARAVRKFNGSGPRALGQRSSGGAGVSGQGGSESPLGGTGSCWHPAKRWFCGTARAEGPSFVSSSKSGNFSP